MTNNHADLETYLLDIYYIGKSFNGFQSQADGSAVQDHIEKNLSILLRKKVKIKGASRTDSGVHAFGQKATFRAEPILEPKKFLLGVNALLPNEIGICSLDKVPNGFDPIRNAKAKVYKYTLWLGRCYNPFVSPYVWQVPKNLDFGVLESSLKALEGEHDFTSFCNTDSSAKTRVRNIIETKFNRFENSVDIWFLGEGFLKQMIRIIVGTLVDIALKRSEEEDIRKILALKNRTKSGQTAPAQALSLIQIFYDAPPRLSSFVDEIHKKSFFYR